MQNRQKSANLIVQLWDLLLIELTNWRWSWQSILLTSIITPCLNIFVMGMIAGDSDKEVVQYIFIGNVVFALIMSNLTNIQNHFVYMRFMGVLDFFVTLPIKRTILVLTMVMSFFILSLPSIVTTIFVGSLILDINLSLHPLLFLVIPCAILPISAIGILIGSYVRSMEEGSGYSLLVTLLAVICGPILIPIANLPGFLYNMRGFNLAWYISSALRGCMFGGSAYNILLNCLVLVAISILLFIWVSFRVNKQIHKIIK